MTSIFDPQGPAARQIADLGWLLFVLLGAIYVVVMAAAGWALARRRHAVSGGRHDDEARGSSRLVLWVGAATALTAVTLVILTAVSVSAGRGLTSPPNPDALTVDVIGHQWWWDFTYRDQLPANVVSSPNELHIPVGVPVVLNVASRDVVHSFWVPNLHGKRDLIPGQVTRTWIQADRPGVFRGQCAEFCGHQHAHMALLVVVEPMAQFQAWLARQREPAREPSDPAAVRGRDTFLRRPCASCHTIRGTAAGSRVGPDLTHVGSRRRLAANTLPNTPDRLAEWVIDPQAIKPGSRMPAHSVASDDVPAVVAYLRSLQ